jgi:hypothetical protein
MHDMSKTKRRKGRTPEPLDHWPRLRQELAALVAELGRFPTPHDLERRGRYDMMRAIVRQGGSIVVAKRLAAEGEAALEASTPEKHEGDAPPA